MAGARKKPGPLVGGHWWKARGLRSKSVYLAESELAALEAYVRDNRYQVPKDLGSAGRRGLTYQRLLRAVIVRFLKKEGYLPRRYALGGD
jgi:hypothetical protein